MVYRTFREYVWNNKRDNGFNLFMSYEDNGIDEIRVINIGANGLHKLSFVWLGYPEHNDFINDWNLLLTVYWNELEYDIKKNLINCLWTYSVKVAENMN